MDTLHAEPDTASATERAILADVRARFEATENPRLRQLVLGLIDHLHAFVGEQKVTWSEWEYFMGFLARAAAVTKDGRNEFIALSNSIGVSMQVLAASQPKPPGATIPTLIGPFFIDDAPVFPIGADIARGASGQPLYAHGRVLDTEGQPVVDAILNVWQSDDRGLYDVQDNFDPAKMWGRGRIQCDAARPLRLLERDADRLPRADGRRPRRPDPQHDGPALATRAPAFCHRDQDRRPARHPYLRARQRTYRLRRGLRRAPGPDRGLCRARAGRRRPTGAR